MVVVVGVAAVVVAVVGCPCLREQERAAAERCWSSAVVSACEGGVAVLPRGGEEQGESWTEVVPGAEPDELPHVEAT